MPKTQFAKHLQDAKSSIQAAANCPLPHEILSPNETRQTLVELKLAIDCLLYASQPQPKHD